MKLRPLPRGGVIGIMSPSSPVDESRLEKGINYLESLGYRIVTTQGCYSKFDYLAGSPEQRAEDLMSLISNPSVDVVFCSRGGFGSMGMLPHLSFSEIKEQRKLITGFSDVTALQWAIYAKTGLPSLSAAMPAIDFGTETIDPGTEASFWEYIESGRLSYSMKAPSPLQESSVSGTCMPATLSVAIRLCGTRFEPRPSRPIYIFEDVNEPMHKTEGCFLQASMAGWFDHAAALVLGSFTPPEKETFPD
ncbi:LD-carboxypeptidase, partial [Balneolaceae bacterium ANBcel3]|nr:LD-carboxypeptidase [Balneolaceae bacterium ANBcel3]